MTSVLLLTNDLAVSSRVAGAASAVGASLEVVRTPDELMARAAGRPIILDLESPGVDPRSLAPQLRSLQPPPSAIVAFAPHVRGESIAAARESGCDEVLSRGRFFAELVEILHRLAK